MDSPPSVGRAALGLVRAVQVRLGDRRPVRLLGLDVGVRRIGLAWADSDQRLASALSVVRYARPSDARCRSWSDGQHAAPIVDHAGVYSSISALCESRHPDVLVVGYPYEPDGYEGPSCVAVRTFIAGLHRWRRATWTPPPAVYWDERFSSTVAESNHYLRHGRPARDPLDADAATLILQGFLEALSEAETAVDTNYTGLLDGHDSSFSEHLQEKALRAARFQTRQRHHQLMKR